MGTGKVPVKITYTANVQPIMVANCTPCHFPPKGFKKPYDTYEAVVADIEPILTAFRKIRMIRVLCHSSIPNYPILQLWCLFNGKKTGWFKSSHSPVEAFLLNAIIFTHI